MIKLTPEQFRDKYGVGGVNRVAGSAIVSQPEIQDSYTSRVVQSIKAGLSGALEAEKRSIAGEQNPLRAGVDIAKGVSSAIVAPIMEITPLKKLGEGFGKVGEFAVETGPGQQLTDFLAEKLSPEDLELAQNLIETGLNVGAIEGGIRGVKGTASVASDLATQVVESGSKVVGDVAGVTKTKLGNLSVGQSANIMNRVARLKPRDAQKFESIAGETHGQYLTRTGNFGAPDKIVTTEATKWVKSKQLVDETLAKLPGEYKPGAVEDALTQLVKKAEDVSTKNVEAPYLRRVNELYNKYKDRGLTMSEINEVKRLFERNVKLEYNKLLNADKVQQATNVDTSIRNWQVKQAETLGFENIAELNRQTRISRLLADSLGDQIVGKTGLNGVSLTDWIVLSGGDIQNIAGFVTKKLFSSKSVQAKIAEMLNNAEIDPMILPELTQSRVLGLPAPTTQIRSSSTGGRPIKIPPPGGNFESLR